MKLSFPNGDHGEVVTESGTLSIGSGAGNDVVLDAEGISEKHARLSHEADGTFLTPVGEADVFVNGRRIRDRTQVRAGDVVGLHRVQVRLAQAGGAPSPQSDEHERPRHTGETTRLRPAVATWHLRGVSGESFGRLVPVQGRMVIGRGDDCDLVLEADEVSRRHAALEVGQAGVTVEDLESSNGTFVNRERIRGKHLLKRGDEIAFDTLRFRLESSQGGAARPAQHSAPVVRDASGGRGAALLVIVALGAVAVLGALLWWYSRGG